jgi:hypothetical protein
VIVCPECSQPFEQRTGPGRKMVFCSLVCRGRAKRRREHQRAHTEVRRWYEQVACGQLVDETGLISATWAQGWLDWQDGKLDDPLAGVLR